MVGGALDREIERDLHAMAGAGRDQPAEIVERAQFGMDRVMSALDRADRVGAAGIAGLGAELVVAALAIDAPDGMDRRQVKDIEAERGNIRQARDAIVE